MHSLETCVGLPLERAGVRHIGQVRSPRNLNGPTAVTSEVSRTPIEAFCLTRQALHPSGLGGSCQTELLNGAATWFERPLWSVFSGLGTWNRRNAARMPRQARTLYPEAGLGGNW